MSLKISEDKYMSITFGVLGVCLAFLFGFAAWVTSVELKAQDLSKGVVKIETRQEQVESLLSSIDKRLYRIELLLERITKGD